MATWKTVPLVQATAGTNADMTMAAGDTINQPVLVDDWSPSLSPVQFDGEQPAVFSVQLNVPSVITPEGCIFEVGGNTRGAMLFFDGNGDLIFRYHNATGRRVVIDNSLIPTDQTITIIAEILHVGGNTVSTEPERFPDQPLDRCKVWVNQNLRGYAQASSRSTLIWSQFSGGLVDGTNVAHVGKSGAFAEVGNFDQAVSTSGVTWVSGLRYYRNAIIEQPARSFRTLNVLQEASFNRRTLALDSQDSRVAWINNKNLRIDYANSTFTTQVVQDHNRISDVKFEDVDTHQVTWLNHKEVKGY